MIRDYFAHLNQQPDIEATHLPWGYAREAEMRDDVIERIKQQLGEEGYTVRTGEEVLNEL